MMNIAIRRFHPIIRAVFDQPLWVVTLITLLAAALRIFDLGERPFWLDEAKVYWTTQIPISQSYRLFSGPPLYPFLIYMATSIDNSEWVLRGVSCIAGILSVPVIYALARRVMRRQSAYLCALMTAISFNQVYYSQQLREYSLTFLLTILILLLFHRFLGDPHWKHSVLLGVACILGIVNQYGIALLILSLNLVIAGRLIGWRFRPTQGNRSLVLRWTMIQLLIIVVSAVLYQLVLKHQFAAGGFGGTTYLSSAYWNGSISSLLRLLLFETYQIFDFAFVYSSLFLLLCALGVVYLWLRGRLLFWLLALPFAVTFLAACLRLYPYHGNRHIIYLTPMLYIAAALGYDMLTNWNVADNQNAARYRPAVVWLLIGALVVPALYHTGLYLNSEGVENIRPLVQTLNQSAQSGDQLYAGCSVDEALAYYYPPYRENWTLGVYSAGLNRDLLTEWAAGSGRIWLIFAHCDDSERRLTVEFLSTLRPVYLVDEASGAWLYRADERSG